MIVGLLLVGMSSAQAGEGDRPPTWDMSLEQLQAIGLGQSRGEPIVVPPNAPRLRAPDEPVTHAKQGVIFINYDGAQLSSGWDDSRANTTQIQQLAGNYPAYGEGAKRDAVTQAVRTDWQAYNVIITDTRPASGDYTMNMTGPNGAFGQGVLGIAPLDCNDSQTHNNITFAFHSVNDQFSAATTATTVGQEVAHSYGLEHVNEPGDIMNPYNAGGDPAFIDQCINIVSNQGIACGQQHQAQCGSSSAQNAHQELLELFGPSAPDTQAPVVTITSPSDGDFFMTGSDFVITVDATDDNSIEQVQLYSNGSPLEADASAPYGWSVNDIPAGTYEFYVTATDLSGNEATSNTVVVEVGDMPSDDGNDGDDGEDGGDGDESGGEDDGMSDGDSGGPVPGGELPPGFGEDGDRDDGCGCVVDRSAPAGSALLLGIALLGLRRRRR